MASTEEIFQDKLEDLQKFDKNPMKPHSRLEAERVFWVDFISHFDLDKNGKTGILEFVGVMEAVGTKADDKQLNELFKQISSNEDDVEIATVAEFLTSEEEMQRRESLLKQALPQQVRDAIHQIIHSHHSASVAHSMFEHNLYRTFEKLHQADAIEEIDFIDRETGKLQKERIPDYSRIVNRMIEFAQCFEHDETRLRDILYHLAMLQKERFDAPDSKEHIAEFVEHQKIDLSEVKKSLDEFQSFNEFFFRELKEGVRPVAHPENPKVLVSSADSRITAYHTFQDSKIYVKGKRYSLKNLIHDSDLENYYSECSVLINRLIPKDYHRFHASVDGKIIFMKSFPGTYYPVKRTTVGTPIDVYTENHRVVVVVQSDKFETVTMVPIGATMVGSINFFVKCGDRITRGQELGYFAYGGSAMVTLFRKNVVTFDDDIIQHSKQPIELFVKAGQSLGTAN